MGYIKSIFNNTRYIVFIQTKYHQDILPADDVSPHSLDTLLETIGSPRGGNFRSIRVHRDDITSLRIYELNFMNYKNNVLLLSKSWNNIYKQLRLFSSILDWILYMFVYKSEINDFGKKITNSKPKYLIDLSENVLKILHGKRKDYPKNKEGKEIIKNIDCYRGKLIINEEILKIDEKSKSGYFLKLFTNLVEKHESPFIDLYDYIEYYENNYYDDGFELDFLNLDAGHIRKTFITTINDNVLKEYNEKILEIKNNEIKIIQNS